MLKAMVALQQRDGTTQTSTSLAERFDELMLSDISKMLQRVNPLSTSPCGPNPTLLVTRR